MGESSPYRVSFFDGDEGLRRFLKLLVIMNLILNALYYSSGPGRVVFNTEDEQICDFVLKSSDTFYYDPDFSDGNKIAILSEI